MDIMMVVGLLMIGISCILSWIVSQKESKGNMELLNKKLDMILEEIKNDKEKN